MDYIKTNINEGKIKMQSFKQKILKVIKPIIVFIGIVKMPFTSKAKVFNNYFETN
jgi:hypothetical protein